MADHPRGGTASPGNPSVDILLGTYNGAAFLEEQLASLAAQTFRSWRLLVRDDGSSDATREILAAIRAREPERVVLIEDAAGRLGPAGNFGRLLIQSSAEFGMFCDQDDVWHPDKIATLVAAARAEAAPEIPLLIHCDLEVVDRSLRSIAPSLWRYQRIRAEQANWPRLLVDGVVTGCACLFNAALARAASPLPPEAILHDRWLALVAATRGRICRVEQVLVRYRQHGRNDAGVRRWGLGPLGSRSPFRGADSRRRVQAYERQAGALARHRAGELPPVVRAILEEFAQIGERPYWQRVQFVRQYQIAKAGWLRNLLFLLNL